MDLQAEEWLSKGATLSDKTARSEFGLTQEEIIAAIRAGKLQYRPSSMHGNPWLRLLRREVEDLVSTRPGVRSPRARSGGPCSLPISVSKVPGSRDERGANPRLGRGDRFHHDAEHGRVLAGQDRLAFQPGADGTVDGRAAAAWLARADGGTCVLFGLEQAGDDAHLPLVDPDGAGLPHTSKPAFSRARTTRRPGRTGSGGIRQPHRRPPPADQTALATPEYRRRPRTRPGQPHADRQEPLSWSAPGRSLPRPDRAGSERTTSRLRLARRSSAPGLS